MSDDEMMTTLRAGPREAHGQKSLRTIGPLGDLGRAIIEFAYGEVYSRPGPSIRDRQIASVSSLVALGRSSQLPVHLSDRR